ncbi:hypothetical protein [Tenacibaculum finnmarkense]|uniref:hypothetical protein n=1 Tax=Tenacibaculum finnmarkense TaxID=2781243 RepID=UPI00187BB7C2|nr:hypothetical protein [Tenacibaculum finnmarkense]MBE7693057.1 hypothetical protein [Tenacibaculum finnmarkense genomovar finnmarkense]
MIKERILKVVGFKGFKKEDFFNKIGMTSANFRGKAKERPINSIAIENIFTVIPDLSLIWLLTGKGEMLVSEIGEKSEKGEKSEIEKENKELNTEIRELNTENRVLNREIRELNTEIKNLNNEIIQLTTGQSKRVG